MKRKPRKLPVYSGKLRVRAGGRKWTGYYTFRKDCTLAEAELQMREWVFSQRAKLWGKTRLQRVGPMSWEIWVEP